MAWSRGERTLAELAAARGRALTGYAFLLTGEAEAAQDLVQDAFVKVFARSRNGSSADVAEAYVRSAILTLYVDGYRRRQRWASVRHLLATAEQGAGPDLAAAERIDLHAALELLAPRERASVVLRFYEDLTVPEIAARLQVSPGAIKRYLSNAMRKLETRLGPMPALRAQDDGVPVLPVTARTDRS